MINNPILPGFNPDPSILRVGEDYYIATSTFEWYPGVQIHHSKDLVNWRLIAQPLKRADLLDMRGNPDSCGIWAPCLSWHDGLFHLIYTDVKRFEGNYTDAHNYLTTCKSITGQWSERVYMNSSGFDPSLFHDDDGKKWFVNMVWDYRPKHHPFKTICLQEYSPEQKQLIGPITNIFQGTDSKLTEAPHLYKRGQYYYLITAEGGTGYDHAMTMARSLNLAGPYEIDPVQHFLTSKDDPNLVLQRSGHGDFVDTPSGETYVVHLCGRPILKPGANQYYCPMGRETAIQKATWNEEGWLRLNNNSNKPDQQVLPPNLPEHPWPLKPARTNFDIEKLPLDFQWLRSPWDESMFSLKARPGYLRIVGHESPGSLFKHALIARRQQAFNFTAITGLEFSPEHFQQQAGLIAYYNGHKFHYLYISRNDKGEKHLSISSCEGNRALEIVYPSSKTTEVIIPEDMAVYLRAQVKLTELHFSWSLDGKDWQILDCTLDYSLISDEAGRGEHGSFTGAFIGMSCHDVSGSKKAADFSFFEYKEA